MICACGHVARSHVRAPGTYTWCAHDIGEGLVCGCLQFRSAAEYGFDWDKREVSETEGPTITVCAYCSHPPEVHEVVTDSGLGSCNYVPTTRDQLAYETGLIPSLHCDCVRFQLPKIQRTVL